MSAVTARSSIDGINATATVSLADQIEFATIIRNSFEHQVSIGAKSTNAMSMEAKLDRAEAILLTIHLQAAHEVPFAKYLQHEHEFSAYLAKQGKEAGQ